MKKMVNVSVNWISTKLNKLPEGLQYITVAKFKEDINWQNESWSIEINFNEPPIKQGNPSKGIANFLVEAAPQDRLKSGEIFELYE